MKKENVLTAKNIIENYPEYNVGSNPFKEVEMEQRIKQIPDTLFKSWKELFDKTPINNVRMSVLQVAYTKQEVEIVIQVAEYLEGLIESGTFINVFKKNQKRFIRFCLDISPDKALWLFSRMVKKEFENGEKFVNLIRDSIGESYLDAFVFEFGRQALSDAHLEAFAELEE